MDIEKIETVVERKFTTYVADPPPAPGQDLRAVVYDDGAMTITLKDPINGAFVWNGILVAAPVIRDLLTHVIDDQAGSLDPEEVPDA